MSRSLIAAAALALIPVAAFADSRKPSESPGAAKPAKFDVQPATFSSPPASPVASSPAVYQNYGLKLRNQLLIDWYNCSPDGCPTPLGCGNGWTEKRFIFGNCRQFFGSAQSTIGHGHDTTERAR